MAMTEVEFSRPLSGFTETANALNRKSDSINEAISRFQETLRKINVGLEVWLTSPPLNSRGWTKESDDGETVPKGTTDHELGFAKFAVVPSAAS